MGFLLFSLFNTGSAGILSTLFVEQPASFQHRVNLTVKWDHSAPASTVFVSAWSPPDFELPVKYASLNESEGWMAGHGEIKFELLNIR
jgi:hypothetical protein